MKKIRIAVIGTGHLGKFHAAAFAKLKGVELTGVCDTQPEKADTVAASCGTKPYYAHNGLLGKVDAVSVVVPTTSHYKIAKDFLKSGVHVFLEKPMARTLPEADRLILMAKEKRLILQVGHIERFNPAIQALYKMANKPRFIECHRLGPFKGRGIEVGVVLDLMIHDLDIVLGLVKSKPARVEAVGVNVLTNSEDIANARITFENGTVCNLTASRLTQEAMRKIRVFQSDAYISIDYLKRDGAIYRKEKDKIISQPLIFPEAPPLELELASFVDCVRKNKKPLVSGEEGRNALNIALRIVKKINTNGAP